MRILNAIVASDRTNGIGFTKKSQGYGNVSLPWKLAGEFKYYCEMVEFKEENAGAKKNVLICGPAVFKEASLLHPEGHIWVVVSKSIKEKPIGCDILTSDYSLSQMFDLLDSAPYKGNTGNLIVLGGVGLYDTLMNSTTIKSRFFWTRIDADCEADRKIQNLDLTKWHEIKQRSFKGFPPLPEKQTEVNQVSGSTVSWYVHVYQNFDTI